MSDACEVLSWLETWKWAAIEVPMGFGQKPIVTLASSSLPFLFLFPFAAAAAMAMAMAVVDVAMARLQPSALHTFTTEPAVPSWAKHGEVLRNSQSLPRHRLHLFSLACTYRPTLNTSTTSQDEAAALGTSRSEFLFSLHFSGNVRFQVS